MPRTRSSEGQQDGQALWLSQKIGVRFLIDQSGTYRAAVEADAMGMGKTLTAIAGVIAVNTTEIKYKGLDPKRPLGCDPTLFIVPSSLKRVWISDLQEKCTRLRSQGYYQIYEVSRSIKRQYAYESSGRESFAVTLFNDCPL